MTGPDAHGRSPDVTDSVMRRLGYRRTADRSQARAIRARLLAVRVSQAATVIAAVALGVVWWNGRAADRSQPAVGDAMRGTGVQGAGRPEGDARAAGRGAPARAQAQANPK